MKFYRSVRRHSDARMIVVGITCALLCASGCAGPVSGVATDRPRDKPNIIVLVSDDAGYADFGFTGSTQMTTPHLSQLAREGVTFEQAYVTASVCSPSRAGLLTGRYQQRFGHEFNLPYDPAIVRGLPLSERTLANRLGEQGYRCAAFGKWHLGAHDGYHPLDRGFDTFSGFLGGSRSYYPLKKRRPTQQWYRDRLPVDDPAESYVTDRIAADVGQYIRANSGEPFFLYVAFTAVHTPMHAQPQDLAPFVAIEKPKVRKLAAMTLALDRAVGEILTSLESSGDDNTIVWFINDNGGATNNGSDNGQLRGMKGSKWEGGVRVPALLRWPGVVEPGTRHAEPISSLDISATAITAADGSIEGLDGVDLRSQLQGDPGATKARMFFWRRGPAAAIRDGRWKLIRVESNPIMLFDLDADRGETQNLAHEHSEVVNRLTAALDDWESGLATPLWTTGKVWRENQIRKHRLDVVGRKAERKLP